MKKFEILSELLESGVVAVIRAENPSDAVKRCKAVLKGGIKGLEVTFTVPGAEEVIKEMSQDKDAIVGAGTVLDEVSCRYAILKGAKFIVSPSFDAKVAEICNLYQIPYIPGCRTPTEVVTARKAGSDLIKIFPGSLPGPDYLKALHGPLPQASFLPSGGVSLENVKGWIKCGASAVSAGGYLTAPAKNGDYEEISKRSKAFVDAVKEARKA